MSLLQYRCADEQDVPELTAMNQDLIRDEGSRNPMHEPALARRMSEFLRNDWRAVLFLQDGQTVGYALFQERPHEYDSTRTSVYLRQFYIRDAFRRQGLGSEGIRLLREAVFPASAELSVDVLASNRAGSAFWERLGFQPYAAHMILEPHASLATMPPTEQDKLHSNLSFEHLLAEARAVVRPRKLSDSAEAGGVGAALLAADGRIYTGVCIDTACSMGFCAEHAAAAAMITHGESRVLKMVAVGQDGAAMPPCGRCREFVSQLHPDNVQTEVMVRDGVIVSLGQLLPHDWRG